jgi:hypothetical protein
MCTSAKGGEAARSIQNHHVASPDSPKRQFRSKKDKTIRDLDQKSCFVVSRGSTIIATKNYRATAKESYVDEQSIP